MNGQMKEEEIMEIKKYNLPLEYDKLSPKKRREVRNQYIEEQNGKCWYCKGDLNKPVPNEIFSKPINLKLFPPGFLNSPIHLQHDHYTGMTEGAVHGYCNGVLWQYEGR